VDLDLDLAIGGLVTSLLTSMSHFGDLLIWHVITDSSKSSLGSSILVSRLTVWLSDNALISINKVTLCWAPLVPGWVIVCRRINHLNT